MPRMPWTRSATSLSLTQTRSRPNCFFCFSSHTANFSCSASCFPPLHSQARTSLTRESPTTPRTTTHTIDGQRFRFSASRRVGKSQADRFPQRVRNPFDSTSNTNGVGDSTTQTKRHQHFNHQRPDSDHQLLHSDYLLSPTIDSELIPQPTHLPAVTFVWITRTPSPSVRAAHVGVGITGHDHDHDAQAQPNFFIKTLG